MAKRGFSGPVRILEGEKGFLKATSSEPALEALTDGLGERYRICEVSVKPYPSCKHSYAQVDAALEIAAEPGFDPDRVRAVRIRTYGAAVELAGGGGRYPRSPREARRSSPYCVAVALRKGRLGPRDFRPDAIKHDDYAKRLVSNTTLEAGDEFDAEYPKRWGAEVEVTMDDGTTLSSSVMLPTKGPGNPASLGDVWCKAVELAEKSHEKGNGLLGVCIHNIKDRLAFTDQKSKNPFDQLYTVRDGKRVLLSEIYPVYDWVYDEGLENFADWVEDAARQAGR